MTAMLIARPITVMVKKSIILSASALSRGIFVSTIPLHKTFLFSFLLKLSLYSVDFSDFILLFSFSLSVFFRRISQVKLVSVKLSILWFKIFCSALGVNGKLKRFSFCNSLFLVSFFASYFWWIKLHDLSQRMPPPPPFGARESRSNFSFMQSGFSTRRAPESNIR